MGVRARFSRDRHTVGSPDEAVMYMCVCARVWKATKKLISDRQHDEWLNSSCRIQGKRDEDQRLQFGPRVYHGKYGNQNWDSKPLIA